MADKYEYHKRNDYPGERIAERKRVADRAEAADKKSDRRVAEKGRTDGLKADARVAEKGRMDDKLMDSEIQRSTARAKGVNRERDTADTIGLVVIAGLLVIIIAGSVWGYMAMQKQSDHIDTLNNQIIESGNVPVAPVSLSSAELSNTNKQIQLHKDFLVMTANVKQEVKDLQDYQISNRNENAQQLCAAFMERENNINHALNRFAEKELVYYRQIAVLANKPQCNVKLDNVEEARVSSKLADEKLYVQNMNQCDRLNSNPIEDGTGLKMEYESAFNNAAAKAKAFENAEKDAIECFA